jgi:hypothetical protein
MLGEQHQLSESRLGRRHFDSQGRLDRGKAGEGMRCATQRKKPRRDRRDIPNGTRRKRGGNPAGASRDQTFRHQTPVDRNGIETNLLFVRW